MKVLFINKKGEHRGGPYTWQKGLFRELGKMKGVSAGEINADAWSLAGGMVFSALGKVRKADVVHVYVANMGILFLEAVARLFGKKVVYTCHGDFFGEWKSKKWPWGYSLFARYLALAKLATHWTFPSSYLMKRISKRMKTPNAEVIFNGVDFSPGMGKGARGLAKKGERLAVMVTSFKYWEKCEPIPVLAREFAEFSKTRAARLVILGEGMYRKKIEDECRGTGAVFTGFAENPHSYIKASDFVIHITGLDNMPLNIIEAMMLKKPVMGSRTGGIPEMSKKLVLVDNTRESIREGLKVLWKKKGTNYPEARELTSRAMAERFACFYAAILPKKKQKNAKNQGRTVVKENPALPRRKGTRTLTLSRPESIFPKRFSSRSPSFPRA